MNLRKTLKLFLILSLFIFACSKQDTTDDQEKQDSSDLPDITYSTDGCKAVIIPQKDTECSYKLPKLESGEDLFRRYLDTSDTKGITIGGGYWFCKEGIWHQDSLPLCLTCRPEHSLEHCIEKWDEQWERLRSEDEGN